MKAIILAGGFATRLWPLTEKRAKPLLLLMNIEILSHIVENIPDEVSIIISTNLVFKDHFQEWKDKSFPKRDIEVFIEDSNTENEKIGALGAVSLIIQQKKLSEDIIIIAGDNYFSFSLQSMIQEFSKNPILAVFDIQDLHRAKQFGVVVPKNKTTVQKFEEKPEYPTSSLVSTGICIFPKNYLQSIIEYAKIHSDNLGGIFEYLLEKKKTISMFPFQGNWFDIGSFQGYLDAHIQLQKEKVLISKSSKITNSKFKGAVSVADNCQIKNSVLDNVIIFSDVIIENCEIRNSIIDSGCIIKNLDLSFKIIKSDTELK